MTSPVKLHDLDRSVLEAMRLAGQQINECYRVLHKSGANPVGELLKHQGEFLEWDHYPKGDVYDNENHSQYYYHAHPPETRLDIYGPEHGHFHTFVRPKGMPPGVQPARLPDYEKKGANDDLCHLIGISMDRKGFPTRAFTTNRWVTGETWYDARDAIRIMDRFFMDLSYPSWPVNIWITAMMRLFRPQFEILLQERDTCIDTWKATRTKGAEGNIFENRDLEITSYVDISVDSQIKAVEDALK